MTQTGNTYLATRASSSLPKTSREGKSESVRLLFCVWPSIQHIVLAAANSSDGPTHDGEVTGCQNAVTCCRRLAGKFFPEHLESNNRTAG